MSQKYTTLTKRYEIVKATWSFVFFNTFSMSGFVRFARLLFFTSAVLVVPFLLSGCFGENTDVQRSKAGYVAEEFLPSTTPLFVSYSTLDVAQKQILTDLETRFPSLADASLEEKFVDGLGFDAWNFGDLAFTEQLNTLFVGGTRIAFALNILPDTQLAEDFTSSGKYLFAVVNDASVTKGLFDQVVSASNGAVTGTVDETTQMPIYADVTNQVFVSLVGDLFVMTDSDTLLKEALARGIQKTDSLATTAAYKDTMDKLPHAYIASVYFASDMDLLDALAGAGAKGPVIGEGFVFVAEEDGLKIEGYSQTDSSTFQALGIDRASFIPEDLVLVDKVPGQNVIFASEAKNLGGVIDFVMKTIAKQQAQYALDESTSDSTIVVEDFYASFKEKFNTFTTLNWDTDVLTFLGQNYLVAMSAKAGNVIPGITIMADARDNVDGARKLVEKLNTQIEGLLMILRLNAGTEGTDLFVKDTVEVAGAEAYRVSVDFSQLGALTGAATAIPAVISSQSFALTYGVTGDNVFFLSTHPDFASTYGVDVLSQQENYKEVARRVDLENGVFFMAPATVSTYLDAVISFQETLNGPLAVEDKQQLDEIKAFLETFQSFIVTAEMDDDAAWTHGYVLLGQ